MEAIRQGVGTDVEIEIRADSGFATPRLYEFCEGEENQLQYVIGLSRNPRLQRVVEPLLDSTRERFVEREEKQRQFDEFLYRANSWDRSRRVIVKVEVDQRGINRRFVVTNRDDLCSQSLYDHYTDREQTENFIKAFKNHLSMDRLSCHRFLANQFRLLLHALAYQMFVRLRDYLHGTPWHKARNRNLTSSCPQDRGPDPTNHSTHLGPSFLSLSRTTPLSPRLESPELQLASPSSPKKPLPTLIQAQICLKFTPPTTQTPRQPIFFANPPVTTARFRVGPLLEPFFNSGLRFLHNPGYAADSQVPLPSGSISFPRVVWESSLRSRRAAGRRRERSSFSVTPTPSIPNTTWNWRSASFPVRTMTSWRCWPFPSMTDRTVWSGAWCRLSYPLRSRLLRKQVFTGGFGQIVRRDILERAGGFSEKVWRYVLLDHEIMNRVLRHGRALYHPDLWCRTSTRRRCRSQVRWTLVERLLYHATPFSLKNWFFYDFLGPRLACRNQSHLRLRERDW